MLGLELEYIVLSGFNELQIMLIDYNQINQLNNKALIDNIKRFSSQDIKLFF